MASFYLVRPPPIGFRNFSVSASSNGSSLPSQSKGPVIKEIPVDQIRRPLLRTRSNDQQKVQQLMDSISEIGLQVPIDVLEVDGVYYGKNPSSNYKTFAMKDDLLNEVVVSFDHVRVGFSGCHRYEAHQRLGLPTIRCKIRKATKETLRHHLR